MKDTFTTSSGDEIPIFFETRRGMRNITIRPKVMPKREIHVSVPWLVSRTRALRFIEEKRRWLERIFEKAPKKTSVADGDIISLFGQSVLIRHNPYGRAGVYMEKLECDINQFIPQQVMVVCGAPDMLERRVRDEIKKQFLIRVKSEVAAVSHHSPKFCPNRIVVRDTTSRWGSCSSTGTISLSYRLSFAPYEVMRYVVLHELAHLKHMDHSPKFWATVGRIYGPGYENAKRWLSQNGNNLHQYF